MLIGVRTVIAVNRQVQALGVPVLGDGLRMDATKVETMLKQASPQ